MDVRGADEFRRLEESLLTSEVRRSPRELAALLSDDFVEFGRSGRVFRKNDVLEAADRLPDVSLPLGDFAVRELSPTAVLVTYVSETRDPDGDVAAALRSSVWALEAGAWRLVFHQGTPCVRRHGGSTEETR